MQADGFNRKNRSFDNRLALALAVISFTIFYCFKLDFILTWDGFGYLRNMCTHTRCSILLGRPGFIFFFAAVWDVCNKIFNLPVLEFYRVVMLVNLVFSSCSAALVYLIVNRITLNRLVSFAAALILVFSKDFIGIAGDALAEPMMIFTVLLSYLIFIRSVDRKELFCFYLSAAIFGYAFLVRESALFSAVFFPLFILTAGRPKYLRAKHYLLFVLIFLLIASSMPVYSYLKEGAKFIQDIAITSSWNRLDFHDFPRAYQIMRSGFGILFIPLAGFIILLFKKEFLRLLLVLSFFLPNLVFAFYGNKDNRYFVFGYIGLAIFSAYCLFYLAQYMRLLLRLTEKQAAFCFLAALICLLSWNFNRFFSPLMSDKQASRYFRDYGADLLRDFPENTVFIIGDFSALLGHYYIPLTGSKKDLIWPGWIWPGDKLKEAVEACLDKGKIVVVDPESFNGPWFNAQKKDVLNLIAVSKTRKAAHNLVELYK